MLLEAGVTVTVGVVVGCVTITDAVPDALLYEEELALSGVYLAVSMSDPAEREPAGIVMVAEPELSVADDEV